MKNIKNHATKIDLFIEKVFLFGKLLSAVVLAVAVCIIGFSVLQIMSMSESLSVPTLEDLPKKSDGKTAVDSGDGRNGSQIKERSSEDIIELKYGQEIKDIVNCCFADETIGRQTFENAKEVIVKWVDAYETLGYGGSFVKGLRACLRKAYSEHKKSGNGERFDGPYIVNAFHSQFEDAVRRVEKSKKEAAERRALGWIVLTYSLGSLIVFLIIPLLIKQEENSRMTSRLLDSGLFDEKGHVNYQKQLLEAVEKMTRSIDESARQREEIVSLLKERKPDAGGKAEEQKSDSSVHVICPSCKREIAVPVAATRIAGQHIRCPYCGAKFTFES